jgi:hypothetical protein
MNLHLVLAVLVQLNLGKEIFEIPSQTGILEVSEPFTFEEISEAEWREGKGKRSHSIKFLSLGRYNGSYSETSFDKENSIPKLQGVPIDSFSKRSLAVSQQILPNFGYKSSTFEPSVAMNGQLIFYTGNWMAAKSVDGGITWTFVDPFLDFLSFCCDQDVIYSPTADRFIWYRQGILNPGSSSNTGRLCFSQNLSSFSCVSFAKSTFEVFNAASKVFFDYPHLGLTNKYLHLSSNYFLNDANYATGSLVFRLNLELLVSGSISVSYSTRTNEATLTPVSSGTSNTMYYGVNAVFPYMMVLSWPDDSNSLFQTIVVASGTPWRGNGYSCPTPDGRDWCGRANSRILGGSVADSSIFFVWNSSPTIIHPLPFLYVSRLSIVNNTSITFNSSSVVTFPSTAVQYGHVASNSEGKTIMNFFFSSYNQPLSWGMALYDPILNQWVEPTLLASCSIGPDPATKRWGDYIRARIAYPSTTSFILSGYTLDTDCAGPGTPCNEGLKARLAFYTPDTCSSFPDCATCQSQSECGWCSSTASCRAGSTGGPASGVCASWVSSVDNCPSCSQFSECSECSNHPSCGFCGETQLCQVGGLMGPFNGTCQNWVYQNTSCDPCFAKNNCNECSADPTCGWCYSSNSCRSGSLSGPMRGSCPAWSFNSTQCDTCLTHTECSTCSNSLDCGWCFTNSKCQKGSTVGPEGGICPRWSFSNSSCDRCTFFQNCSICTNTYDCGWCYSNNQCGAGTEGGPTGFSCSDWRWFVPMCLPTNTSDTVSTTSGTSSSASSSTILAETTESSGESVSAWSPSSNTGEISVATIIPSSSAEGETYDTDSSPQTGDISSTVSGTETPVPLPSSTTANTMGTVVIAYVSATVAVVAILAITGYFLFAFITKKLSHRRTFFVVASDFKEMEIIY